MKRLLFICWDGPQVNYLEGLFLPILKGLKEEYEIHVLQFTWGAEEKSEALRVRAAAEGIRYERFSVSRKPLVALGALWTLIKGARFIRRYTRQYAVDIIMPRSTFPTWMTCRAVGKSVRLIVDADGLPIDERVDFAGLSPRSLQYKLLKKIESAGLKRADTILVRSKAAVDLLSAPRERFHVVTNGRDPDLFRPGPASERESLRASLGVEPNEVLLVYCGSLGLQYCPAEMIQLLGEMRDAKLLLLSPSAAYLDGLDIDPDLRQRIISKGLPFEEVPRYLCAADAGIALRVPSRSMKGVAPIKLGEYLLCGLPVVASRGIGDTGDLLEGEACCLLLSDHSAASISASVDWIGKAVQTTGLKASARQAGIRYFSLEGSISSYKKALKPV